MRPGSKRHGPFRVGFVMEQAMGHLTHHRTLAAEVDRDLDIRPTWMPIHYRDEDLWQRLPGVRGNMSLLLSLRARRQISAGERSGVFDALYFHTQLTALLSQHIMHRVPAVISLDATPLNRDARLHSKAAPFARVPDGEGPWDRLKFEWYRRAFSRASAIVAWSEWARRSLLQDYGIESEKVTVIPPGIDLDLWQVPPEKAREDVGRKPRLLFVGVDFDRKGGDVLMEAFRGPLAGRAVLDVVSPEAGSLPSQTSDIHVHRNLSINSPELRTLFSSADMFVLPTHNDCTPLAILEAMGSGLPVVATDVGAIREQVAHDVTGLLVAPGDVADLAAAIQSLIDQPAKRVAMGAAGRARAEQLFNARTNYRRVVSLIKDCASAFKALEVDGGTTSPRGGAEVGALRVAAGRRAWASEH